MNDYKSPPTSTPATSTQLILTVVGLGYLGAVHAAGMATLGHKVIGLDANAQKVALLTAGGTPFHEPGLKQLLAAALQTGNLTFTTRWEDLTPGDAHFICVGTPQHPLTNQADLSYLHDAITNLLPVAKQNSVIVGKSTVPVGTAAGLQTLADSANKNLTVVWNPEFLREGHAVKDTLHPDRLVFGIPETATSAEVENLLLQIYAETITRNDTPVIVTTPPTAELVKVTANAFLATKISFINAIADICDAAGGDVTVVAEAIGHDTRIGNQFLQAGAGFGGGCLPKDIRAFQARAGELGVGTALTFLKEIDQINLSRRDQIVNTARQLAGGRFVGKNVTVLGAAFKPNSDDVRDSPSLHIANNIHTAGGNITVHDPEAVANARKQHPALTYSTNLAEALTGADLVILGTEWDQYKQLDPAVVGKLVTRKIVYDTRNTLPAADWRAAGFTYKGIGRP